MPKKSGILFVIMGAVLILSALLLFLYNGVEEHRAGQEAELLLDDIQSAIAEELNPTVFTTEMTYETTDTSVPTETSAPEEVLSAEMPVMEIKGYEYIGYLSIPDLKLELPIMSEWSYKQLKIAPCRHAGSTRTDDLVIAAHNYKTHFGNLSKLKIGAEVIFTEVEGNVYRYMLMEQPEKYAPNAVDAVLNSGYDLVLYTCTPGGATRVVAFFDRVVE